MISQTQRYEPYATFYIRIRLENNIFIVRKTVGNVDRWLGLY